MRFCRVLGRALLFASLTSPRLSFPLPSPPLAFPLRAQFKLVYDDGDTESVRLEADAAKRAPQDVNFRWLPDEDARAPLEQHAGDAAGSCAAAAAVAAMESDAPKVLGSAAGVVVEGATAPMLLQDVSNVAVGAAALSPVHAASPRRTTPRRTPTAPRPPPTAFCASPRPPTAPCAVAEGVRV
jgi:hypothetical protein